MLNIVNRISVEMMIKNVTEKIREQEIVYNSLYFNPDKQREVRHRINILEQERLSYVKMLDIL